MSLLRSGANLSLLFPVLERSQIGVSMGYERWNFDFTDATAFDSLKGDPWQGVNRLDLTLTFSQEISDHWSYVVGATVASSYEDGAQFSDSITAGALAGATYKFSDTLRVGAGAIVRSSIEDDALILPLITIDWKISDTLTFSTNPSTGRRFLGLTYQPCEAWAFTGGAAFEFIDFRLDDDTDSVSPDGVGRFRRVPVGVEISYIPSDQFRVGLYGGYVLAQEVTLDDQEGERVQQEEVEPAPFIGLQIQWSF